MARKRNDLAVDIDLPEFDVMGFDLGNEEEVPEKEDVTLDLPEPPKKKKGHRRTTELLTVKETLYWRKAFGVENLLKVMGMERPQQGCAYHIISGGNVDLLCHLQWLMLHYRHLKRVFISAWAISGADILLLDDMVRQGKIDVLDVLVGDIFPNQYKHEWAKLQQMQDKELVRGLYSSNIHSKFILADDGNGMKAVCESSANCNMNPRIEQTVMTFDAGLYDFYDKYYHNLFIQEEIISSAMEFKQLFTKEPEVRKDDEHSDYD